MYLVGDFHSFLVDGLKVRVWSFFGFFFVVLILFQVFGGFASTAFCLYFQQLNAGWETKSTNTLIRTRCIHHLLCFHRVTAFVVLLLLVPFSGSGPVPGDRAYAVRRARLH